MKIGSSVWIRTADMNTILLKH